MIAEAGSGHPGGSLSAADIVATLYFGGVLRHDPANPRLAGARPLHPLQGPRRARCSTRRSPRPATSAATTSPTLRKLGSMLQGHPDSKKTPGVEVSTGSLGQGLSIAAGLAPACGRRRRAAPTTARSSACSATASCRRARSGRRRCSPRTTGSTTSWRSSTTTACRSTARATRSCASASIATKFSAFGWKALEVDGHDVEALLEALLEARAHRRGGPRVIVAHTVKGKGVSFMEGEAGWHGKAPSAEETAQRARRAVGVDRRGARREQEQPARRSARRSSSSRTKGVDVVAVEADLSKSTTTAKLADAYPERFFNVGIAEQNMIDVAAGLAVSGKIAFTGSFAVFATGRAYDQVRNTVCYSDLDVKLAPTHAGITVGPDGGSHQMIEDIALMRVLPGMRVLVPADYNAAKAALRAAATTPGPFYVRLGRAALPDVYAEDFEFELGAAYVLREGTDVTLAACGVEVAEALAAADAARGRGHLGRGHRRRDRQAARRRDARRERRARPARS